MVVLSMIFVLNSFRKISDMVDGLKFCLKETSCCKKETSCCKREDDR